MSSYNESLLVGRDTFDRLLQVAVADERWEACSSCPSVSLCPFRSNRSDLAMSEGREQVISVLRRAEVLSGQVVVFREAIALVSLLLAGCPNDYADGSPCAWVHRQIHAGNVFGLLGRRTAALLLGAGSPQGLEPLGAGEGLSANRREQVKALREVAALRPEDDSLNQAIRGLLADSQLSTDVGVQRLLGRFGALTRLDPGLDPRQTGALDRYFAEVTGPPSPVSDSKCTGLHQLERTCLGLWQRMFELIEVAPTPTEGLGMYFWVRRWQSTCLGRICAVATGTTSLEPELEQYLQFAVGAEDSGEWQRVRRGLERVLSDLLTQRSGTEEGAGLSVELSASMRLRGKWAEQQLRPRLVTSSSGPTESNVIRVQMGGKMEVAVSADTFTWLSRRHGLGLSDLTFNDEVLDALRRAQAQAAAAGSYSIAGDDIELEIEDDKGKLRYVERDRGRIYEGGDR